MRAALPPHGLRPAAHGLWRTTAAALATMVLPLAASAQSSTINVTVTNAATGTPISGASVTLVSPGGASLGSATTNGAGILPIPFLPPATYFLYVTANGFGGEVYDNLACPPIGCSASLAPGGTPIVLTPGSTRSAALSLQPDGQISGTVRDAAGAPLANVEMQVYGRSGGNLPFLRFAATNGAGFYQFVGLSAGEYWVATDASGPYVNEFFDDAPCPGSCMQNASPSIGDPITVAPGATTAGRDFTLARGGRLVGTVVDAATGASLAGVRVLSISRFPEGYRFDGDGNTDATGAFVLDGLIPGDHEVFTSNQLGYINQLTNNIPCQPHCPIGSGTPIAVAAGQTAAANFALTRGGQLTGTVRDAANSAPLGGVSVTAFLASSPTPFRVGSGVTNSSGAFAIGGLATGNYYVATGGSHAWIDEIHPDIACPGECQIGSIVQSGTAMAVTAGATTAGLDFRLTPGGGISGIITDAASATPLSSIFIAAYTRVGDQVAFAGGESTDAAGAFSIGGLPGGSYYLHTFNVVGRVDEIFPDVPCLGTCRPADVTTRGSPIVVTTGAVSGGNFALALGGAITGLVTDAATGTRLPSVPVEVVANVGGTPVDVGTAFSDALGRWVLGNVPAGIYYAATRSGFDSSYTNEVFDNVSCGVALTCARATIVGAGTPIQVGLGAVTSGRNFVLQRRQEPPGPPQRFLASSTNFQVRFTWDDPLGGSPATSFQIEAGLVPGGTSIVLPAAASPVTIPGAPPGRYYVRVRGINAFGLGAASNEVALVIGTSGASLPGPPQALTATMLGARLYASWQPPDAGGPLVGYVLEVGTASGAANIGSIPISGATFTYLPVPNGFYFMRVRAVTAAGAGPPSEEVMLKVGGGPAPPSFPPSLTSNVTGAQVTLSWTVPQFGPVAAYVLEAGTASGLANIVTHNTGSTATTISFSGVPPGTYFVRVRAANALGVSVASPETTVVVP